MGIEPAGDHIFLEDFDEKEEEKKEAGIPQSISAVQEKPCDLTQEASKAKTLRQGTVAAVGPGTKRDGKNEPVPYKPGDRLCIDSYCDNKVKIGDKTYLSISSYNVIAKITRESDPRRGLKKFQKSEAMKSLLNKSK